MPLNECLAKTVHTKDGDKPGVSVETHCRIVGHIAREIIMRLPEWLQSSCFPKGSELIAAAHDVGKICPTFQEKIHREIGVKPGMINPDLDKTIGYHSAVSQAAVSHCPKYIPEILGRHHGYNSQSICAPEAEIYGGTAWQKQRMSLINILKKDLDVDWPMISSALQADIIAGLTVVADWIGSGPLFEEVVQESWNSYIPESLDRAGFVPYKILKGLSFENIFDSYQPRDVQIRFVESVKTQGAYVLEAPMGLGKTEAALYAAYKILEKGLATGIYFALPTQLTSDKIYDRFDRFLENILENTEKECHPVLLHGLAWLKNTEFGEDGSPGHSWFSSSKRGLLAPFAVGTIDQALMAVMNVKHSFVRTFGLAGKVIILDEIHSYDSYTSTIIKELIDALRALHCTVIILSATLTDKQRYALLGVSSTCQKQEAAFSAYPLISAYPQKGQPVELETEKLESSRVDLRLLSEDKDAFEEALLRAQRGELVLWIENSVLDAQEAFGYLGARAEAAGRIECGLMHSRFIKTDRQKNENIWAGIYGRTGRSERQNKGRILIGTQVLEQSLDIDADFLVTRICPTDMLFQRMGRLWRHRGNDDIRPSEAKREAWILSPVFDEAVANKRSLGKSARVYAPYILCRTIEVWQDIPKVALPDEIRRLLEKTYKERNEEGLLATYKKTMEEKRDALKRLALSSVSRGGKTLSDSQSFTRYSEIGTVDVLLIKKQTYANQGVLLRFLNGFEILLPKFVDAKERRKIAAELLKNTVSVPEYIAPNATTRQMEWLRGYVYLGDQEENPFRLAVVQDGDELHGLGDTVGSNKYDLYYNSILGYKARKKSEGDEDEE